MTQSGEPKRTPCCVPCRCSERKHRTKMPQSLVSIAHKHAQCTDRAVGETWVSCTRPLHRQGQIARLWQAHHTPHPQQQYTLLYRICFIHPRTCRESGHYMYHKSNTPQFYVLPTECIYVFCVDLRTNSDYFPIQH